MKKLTLFIMTFLLCSILSITSFAHSGRTDANGGHRDNKNVSGLGSYHYHHGYPAHLHPNGICPYENQNASVNNSEPIQAQQQQPKPAKEYCIFTDIKAKINDNEIPSFSYKDSLFVNCNDLNSYGFDVKFNSNLKTVTISKNLSKEIKPLEIPSVKKGTLAHEIKNTDIKVYSDINGLSNELSSFNGADNMFVKFSDLECFGDITWNNETRTSALTLK